MDLKLHTLWDSVEPTSQPLREVQKCIGDDGEMLAVNMRDGLITGR